MRYFWLFFLIVIASVGCNLTLASQTPIPSPSPSLTDSPPLIATITLTGSDATPTLLPLPNLLPTNIAVTSVPVLGTQCQVYTTYAGVRADNNLSLRSDPSTTATQIFRIPNNIEVLRVPGSLEIAAEGYHWLNVIYEDSLQMRYWGWIARDSFETNGVHNPSIATLRPTARQATC